MTEEIMNSINPMVKHLKDHDDLPDEQGIYAFVVNTIDNINYWHIMMLSRTTSRSSRRDSSRGSSRIFYFSHGFVFCYSQGIECFPRSAGHY